MEVKLKGKDKTQIHVCPISSIRVIGDCQVYECPANLVRLTGGKKTGCFYKKYTASIQDFAIVFGVDQKTAQAAYSNSVSQLEKMTKLYQLLQELREKSKWQYSCSNCGSPLEANYSACLNQDKCSHRAKLVNKQKSRSPFSLPGLGIRRMDIWLFVKTMTKTEIRQKLGVYFADTLWDLLPPLILKELELERK